MTNKLKIIIVDDEVASIQSLKLFLDNMQSEIEILDEATNIDDAKRKIDSLRPDIVLLDIDLDAGNTGFDLLELFPSVFFKVIFITASNAFAIKAIKYSALDYILKPVNQEELFNAIEKAKLNITNDKNFDLLREQIKSKKSPSRIAMQIGRDISIIEIRDIVNCVSDGNYTFVYTLEDKYYVAHSLKELELLLGNNFYRPHKSHLINFSHIKSYSSSVESIIMKNNMEIPLSRIKKDDFISTLNNFLE